jgi:hypothetical protein
MPPSVSRQEDALDALARHYPDRTGPLDVLDCSCGIATQAIGLAERGHRGREASHGGQRPEPGRRGPCELATLVRECGFRDVTWHGVEQSRFFQPVLTARPAA